MKLVSKGSAIMQFALFIGRGGEVSRKVVVVHECRHGWLRKPAGNLTENELAASRRNALSNSGRETRS